MCCSNHPINKKNIIFLYFFTWYLRAMEGSGLGFAMVPILATHLVVVSHSDQPTFILGILRRHHTTLVARKFFQSTTLPLESPQLDLPTRGNILGRRSPTCPHVHDFLFAAATMHQRVANFPATLFSQPGSPSPTVILSPLVSPFEAYNCDFFPLFSPTCRETLDFCRFRGLPTATVTVLWFS